MQFILKRAANPFPMPKNKPRYTCANSSLGQPQPQPLAGTFVKQIRLHTYGGRGVEVEAPSPIPLKLILHMVFEHVY